MGEMRIKNRSVDFNKVLYTITLVLILLRKYSISMFGDGTIPTSILSGLFYGSILLLFIQFIIRKKHNTTELMLFFIACILYLFTREGSILTIILLSISIIDINDDYVVKSYMIITSIFIICSVLFGTFAPDYVRASETHYRVIGSDYVARQTFGFGNPNSTFLFILPLYAGYIYFRFDKYNIYDRLILLVTTLFIYNRTMSRTGVITIIGILLIVEFLRAIDFSKYKFMARLFKLSPLILLIISLIISIPFANNALLNSVLASRPRYWNKYIVTQGNLFTLFGNSYPPDMKTANPLDSSYIYMLAILGVVSLVVFTYILYKGLEIFINKNEKKYLVIVMMFIIYAFAENILLEIGYNFTIILLVKHIIINNTDYFTKKEFIKKIKNRDFNIKNKFRRLKKC